MEIDRVMLLRVFASESEENLTLLSAGILSLEANPRDQETIQEVFRLAHNLKGSSACVGLNAIPEFTHAIEDALSRVRDGSLSVTTELATVLLESVDALQDMVAQATLAGEDELKPDKLALMKLLLGWKQEDHSEELDDFVTRSSSIGAVDLPEKATSTQAQKGSKTSHSNSLRVDIERLDAILNLTGEIAIARGSLRQAIDEMADRASERLLEAHAAADALYLDLQEQVTKIRMVPVEPMLRQYVRTVRDTAHSHGKVARLIIEADDVEVDTVVIEHLRDPLAHIIRNALYHGIEPPEVRKSLGKDPCGQILMQAFQTGGAITLQIGDDGSGMDRERIVERALTIGLISGDDKLSEQEIFDLIFEPGFSTVDQVSDLSGRGVGMDIVRRNVEAIRGRVEVDSIRGNGTRITIRLPLTLAIIEAFGVGVGGETYLIPLESVIECIDLPEEEASHNRPSGVINLRGEAVPYLRLREHFGQTNLALSKRENLVLVQNNGTSAGLVVDALYGESQAVMKPLGRLFRNVPGVSGSTILGNGMVALVLDIPSLLKKEIGLAAEAAENNRGSW